MIRRDIANAVKKAIGNLQKEGIFPDFGGLEVKIEKPQIEEYGDYSTNVALAVAGKAKKSPLDIAHLLSKELAKDKMFKKVEKAPPGFLNFFLSEGILAEEIKEIVKKGEKYGESILGRGKKAQVEFISANPTGPLTVGNARGGPLGDVLANVFKKAGFKTEKAYYFNDAGAQILALGRSVLKDKEAQYKGEYIDDLGKDIKEKDPEKAGKLAAKIIMGKIKKTVLKMKIKYDEWFSEQSLHNSGDIEKTLKRLEKGGFLYQKDGAKWFCSSKFGDVRDRVLVKKDGVKTYLAADIAYHKYKFEKKKFGKVVNVWGADHAGSVAGLKAGCEAIGHKGKLDFVIHQFVTVVKNGEILKMSKRKGVYVTMDELLDLAGADAVRFFFLQKSAGSHLNFDLDLAKEQSAKNPVYYIQYAHARICSVVKKYSAKRKKLADLALLEHKSELDLMKALAEFPEIVEDIAGDYQVQKLPSYSIALAASFHKFYQDCKIICEDEKLSEARMFLTKSARVVLKNALELMGVSVPEKM